jgi:hypothetical protein
VESLTITTWLWGTKYDQSDVAKLYGGLKRNLKQPFRFILFSSQPYNLPKAERYPIPIRDMELTYVPGCFARLRMFDPEFQAAHRINGRLVCIDLDTVLTGNLDPLFDRSEPFVILQGANSLNPCPYTGALMMLRTGAYPQLWSDFNIATVAQIPFHEFPDDQGWIHFKVPDAAGWKAGKNGVYAFCKPGWPSGTYLPRDARLVTFNGWRSPKEFSRSCDWIRKYWVE